MSFMINGKTAFEVALAAVSNANFQKTEATLEFHETSNEKDAQVVESMRFLIMNDAVSSLVSLLLYMYIIISSQIGSCT
jgi:hypothetical protein